MLHHVPDVEGLFASVLGHLEQGGYPAFADLAAEDGSFHDDPEEVQGTGRAGLLVRAPAAHRSRTGDGDDALTGRRLIAAGPSCLVRSSCHGPEPFGET